jgi:hypothetical protein
MSLMALSGHGRAAHQCPFSGVKQTSQFKDVTSAFDPKQTLRCFTLLDPLNSEKLCADWLHARRHVLEKKEAAH